jgi:hypothetical protein
MMRTTTMSYDASAAVAGVSSAQKAWLPRAMICFVMAAIVVSVAIASPAWNQRKTEETTLIGNGPTEFRDRPTEAAWLVGFSVTIGQYTDDIWLVRSIQPRYRTSDGRIIVGKSYGDVVKARLDVEAEAGYAVGAIVAKSGLFVDGFRVVFMRCKGNRLDPNDSYESRWLGGRGGGEEPRRGGDGRPIVGVHGRCGHGIDGLGLIVATAT